MSKLNIKDEVTSVLKTNFFKNIFTQLLGTGVAQVIPVIATLALSKLYTPVDFGIYANFLAISAVLIVLVGGNYQYAIVLPKKKEVANNIFIISLLITSTLSLVIGFVILIFKNYLERALGLEESIYYLPLYVFFYGSWLSLTNLSIRQLAFKNNAISKVIQALTFTVVSIFIGYFFYSSAGLIIGKLLGITLAGIFLFKMTDFSFSKINIDQLWEVALKYKDYPKFGIFPAFLNTVSLQAMVFALQLFYSKEILGFYGFTLLVLTAPLALIGASYKDVFYQKIADLINLKDYTKAYNLFIKSALLLASMAVIMALTLFFFGEQLFGIFFGDVWVESGKYASILAISFAVKLVVSPLSSVFNATNKLKIAAVWQTLYFISTIVLLTTCTYFLKLDIITLLIVYMLHEVLLYFIYFVIQYNLIRNLASKESI